LSFRLFCLCLISASTAFAAPKVLIIGDTHAATRFGDTLHRLLSHEARVSRFAGRGAGAQHFVSHLPSDRHLSLGGVMMHIGKVQRYPPTEKLAMPKLAALLKNEKPQAVVVVLGDDMADYGYYRRTRDEVYAKKIIVDEKERLLDLNMVDADTNIINGLQAIKNQINEAKAHCVVVLPPLFAGSTLKPFDRSRKVSGVIVETMSPNCFFVDTLDLQKKEAWTSKDGILLDDKAADSWAAHASTTVLQALKKPIYIAPPPVKQPVRIRGTKDIDGDEVNQ
jgi:hypothetical protein